MRRMGKKKSNKIKQRTFSHLQTTPSRLSTGHDPHHSTFSKRSSAKGEANDRRKSTLAINSTMCVCIDRGVNCVCVCISRHLLWRLSYVWLLSGRMTSFPVPFLVVLEFFQDLFVLLDQYLVYDSPVSIFHPSAIKKMCSLECLFHERHHGRRKTLIHHILCPL